MEINIASVFVIVGMAVWIVVLNERIKYTLEERNHYKKVSEKLEQDINNLTQSK